ncbi:MAG TPA: sulfotransferase [Candidatus Acidoferrales bacterium]|nr:sulfotransferase [Candidatus Acidoferrales bacterium]
MHLLGLLTTRLRLVEYWRSRCQVQVAAPLDRPIFITGMPRSGSTFLHELLAEDPGNRAPRVWEVMFPVPVNQRPGRADPRIKKAAACLWWFRRLAPQADAVFPMRSNTPHECVAIHSYSFLSEEFISTCRIPAYESFLRQADLRPAYAWQRRFLQHLQSGQPSRRWVLKSPDHVYGLEALFDVFPDALVIQTHRNPLDVLKSSCHLTEVLHGLYARPRPNGPLAERESRVLAAAVERFINFRDAHPELAGRFIDVTYDEITANPLACVRRIYDHFSLPLRGAAIELIGRLARERSRYSNGRPAALSLDMQPATVADATCFERYCSRFNIGWQPTRTP